ncbi:MarR family winged helix-turn-helix transcriptional regulator [Arthrobacter burdickii]|uniref:MarR family transcriptional regulator n=1 Tax=Arthrobacter burdickii TaxID=3035920 RepID=A0ABT8K009_9MICC|nr:MarR family transcriptional regulator [Arthrobacter burdickii]MDN4609932.1 MarR family transcriptional regulator [Arthrobacter burdickii]
MPELNDWSTSRLLTTAARLVEHSWNEKLLSIGITHAGLTTLGVLEREGTLTGVRLAQLVHVQAQTVGRTLDRLEKRGLVTRLRNTADRRSQRITITSAGLKALERAKNIEHELMSEDGLASEDLRDRLKTVINELGPKKD